MKKPETYKRCEYCDEMMLDVSPPPKEQYESARIDIANGTLLLPQRVFEAKGRAWASHAVTLDGVYCSPRCFVNKIRVALGAEPE